MPYSRGLRSSEDEQSHLDNQDIGHAGTLTVVVVSSLREARGLGDALLRIRSAFGRYSLHAHWSQGEFHHDIVVNVSTSGSELPSSWIVLSTNCNGGIKEVLSVEAAPHRWGLWHMRCPDNPDFGGPPPRIVEQWRTEHWFDPCNLLTDDARSELRPEYRKRMRGGGWEKT